MEINLSDAVLQFSVAAAGAAVVGWERELKNRPAGLRTHILVALGACLMTMLALDLHAQHDKTNGSGSIDPLRVYSGIIGGIGFLGAGAIIQSQGRVSGLTTAAGIWLVAAIGVAAAGGYYAIVGIAVLFAFVTLFILGKLETKVLEQFEDNGD